ncbi:hypothetical protein HDU90_001196 [Geranomyces variabilis]|nr:hypothetical protein HDU90_001196 [Geranomyces variabilis]
MEVRWGCGLSHGLPTNYLTNKPHELPHELPTKPRTLYKQQPSLDNVTKPASKTTQWRRGLSPASLAKQRQKDAARAARFRSAHLDAERRRSRDAAALRSDRKKSKIAAFGPTAQEQPATCEQGSAATAAAQPDNPACQSSSKNDIANLLAAETKRAAALKEENACMAAQLEVFGKRFLGPRSAVEPPLEDARRLQATYGACDSNLVANPAVEEERYLHRLRNAWTRAETKRFRQVVRDQGNVLSQRVFDAFPDKRRDELMWQFYHERTNEQEDAEAFKYPQVPPWIPGAKSGKQQGRQQRDKVRLAQELQDTPRMQRSHPPPGSHLERELALYERAAEEEETVFRDEARRRAWR